MTQLARTVDRRIANRTLAVRFAAAAVLAAGMALCLQARADDAAAPPVAVTPAPAPAAPTRHQLMKDCMAKQVASEAGRTKEDMKKDCRDVTKTEKQNADAEKKAAGKTTAPN